MSKPYIQHVSALEILDSRGQPTVKASITLSNGMKGAASVPSGASTGGAEASELRDGDPQRYRGLGCLKAVQHINSDIKKLLEGSALVGQSTLDQQLIDLDGTNNKSRLGANAILAVSLAYAKTMAKYEQLPLYRYFSRLLGNKQEPKLPQLTINLFSGGKHAGAQVPIQDVLMVPIATKRVRTGLEQCFKVYRAAVDLTATNYQSRWLTADEGGLAPPFTDADQMFEAAIASIKAAGFEAAKEIALAVDVAASHFYVDGYYHLSERMLTSTQMIQQLYNWTQQYPIISIEDGLAEEDWLHWTALTGKMGLNQMIMGDDLLCTHVTRIQQAITTHAANALLLKVNQIGTLTEAAKAYQLARTAGWKITISARSGETEDNWLADLAVGWAGDFIKVGSITQSERLAKYNRLLEIEAELEG